MNMSEAKRLRELEDENRRLKQLVAEQALDIAALRTVASKKMVTLALRREAVLLLQHEHCMSERRACAALQVPRFVGEVSPPLFGALTSMWSHSAGAIARRPTRGRCGWTRMRVGDHEKTRNSSRPKARRPKRALWRPRASSRSA
jgi:hypothetical protein